MNFKNLLIPHENVDGYNKGVQRPKSLAQILNVKISQGGL